MQIKCYCNLYTSAGLKKRKNKILKALMERKPLSGISVIILAQGRQNHLEFFSALFLQQHFYDEKELFIVGIAEGKESAVALVGGIVQEVLDRTGGTDLRKYILENQKKFEESRA